MKTPKTFLCVALFLAATMGGGLGTAFAHDHHHHGREWHGNRAVVIVRPAPVYAYRPYYYRSYPYYYYSSPYSYYPYGGATFYYGPRYHYYHHHHGWR